MTAGIFSFIGGKMETTDESIEAALRREKVEEIGAEARLEAFVEASRSLLFRKKDGMAMIIPHYVAHYSGDDIRLNAGEYSEYRWVPLSELGVLKPKIANIPDFIEWALRYKDVLSAGQSVQL